MQEDVNMNYAQLEEFIKTLTPEQKQEPVIIQVLDETSVRMKEVAVNDVDYFFNEDSEGLIPVSEYDPEHWDGKLLTDEDYNTIVPAGSRVFAYDETFGEDDKITHIIRPYQIIAAMNAIGWETKEHGWDKIVFEKKGEQITVLENAKLSTLLHDLVKSNSSKQTAEDYIESVYGTRNFARAIQLNDANSIMDMMNDFANAIRENKS